MAQRWPTTGLRVPTKVKKEAASLAVTGEDRGYAQIHGQEEKKASSSSDSPRDRRPEENARKKLKDKNLDSWANLPARLDSETSRDDNRDSDTEVLPAMAKKVADGC
jgi:hypothetical protein